MTDIHIGEENSGILPKEKQHKEICNINGDVITEDSVKNIKVYKNTNALINRIEVSRDYKVKIDFNFDFEQFTQCLDIAA